MTSHFSEGKGVDSCEEDGGLGSDSGGAIVTVVVTIVITVLCIFVFAFFGIIRLSSSISSRLSSRFSWLSDDLVVSISFDDNHFVAAGSGPVTTAVEDFEIGCSILSRWSSVPAPEERESLCFSVGSEITIELEILACITSSLKISEPVSVDTTLHPCIIVGGKSWSVTVDLSSIASVGVAGSEGLGLRQLPVPLSFRIRVNGTVILSVGF